MRIRPLALLAAVSCALALAPHLWSAETGPDEPPASPETPVSETPAPPAAQTPPRFFIDRLAAGGSFGYYTSDRLRYLSEIHFDFPFLVVRQQGAYLRGSLSSSISRINGFLESDSLSFRVEDVDYDFEAGARDYLTPRIAIAAFLGQKGSENLDRPGSAWARYAGLGVQTATFPRPGGEKDFDWNLSVGKVFSRRGLEKGADWRVEGDMLWDALRFEDSSVGLDLSFDSLVADGDWQSDWRSGPRWSFDLQNGIRASLFARYIHSRNPLGVGTSGWQFGLDYSEGAYRTPREGPFPDVRGRMEIGAGSDRSPAALRVESIFPPFHIAGRDSRILLSTEANSLVGRGPDTFQTNLGAGLAWDALDWMTAEGLFEHRGYHTLSEDIPFVAELNLISVEARSPGWEWEDRTPWRLDPRGSRAWPGSLAWHGRSGWLLSSTDSGRDRWSAGAGARWDLPEFAPEWRPFVIADAEFGASERRRYAIGIATPVEMTISAEYRSDHDLASADPTEYLLSVTLHY